MVEAYHKTAPQYVTLLAPTALAGGTVIQLADGRAGVVAGIGARAAGDRCVVQVSGIVTLAKTASIVLLQGGRVFWDRSAGAATYKLASGDFYCGVCNRDAASAATTVRVDLNRRPSYLIDFDGNPGDVLWTSEATDGVGVTPATLAAPTMLSFDAVAEVAQAALFPTETRYHVPVADGPILEMEVAVYDIGDDAALDINFGLANGSHATDADSITEAVFFHLNGAALSILAESDDGTTEVAATDTTVDAVDDTFFEVWIDCRDLTDCRIYFDGVRVGATRTFKLDAATGPLFPLAHIEKTSNDTTADLRVRAIRLRTGDAEQ